MERTRECGLIWWREGVHGRGDKDCGETGAYDGSLVRIN